MCCHALVRNGRFGVHEHCHESTSRRCQLSRRRMELQHQSFLNYCIEIMLKILSVVQNQSSKLYRMRLTFFLD